MESEQSPMWLRILKIIFGIIAIILSFWLIFIPPLAGFFFLVFLFATGFLLVGIIAIIRGIFNRQLPSWLRIINIILGIIILILAPLPWLEPSGILVTAVMILWLMSFGLIFYGLTSLMMGIAAGQAPGWYRAILVILGPILMIIGFYVIAYPIWGLAFTLWMLCFGLIFAGFELLISGATGQNPRAA
ncbi:MAG: DUF308 domain-containing protein [Promethearchaeota archaeon]